MITTTTDARGQAALEAARSGDAAAFSALCEPHRRELQVHCYRMLGSFEDSEDLVQETFLRAYREYLRRWSPLPPTAAPAGSRRRDGR